MKCEDKENKVDLMGVCRLCLGTEGLISVFDDRITIQQNMVEIIQITSGVIITKNDEVSHKLCKKCISITIKMFKFRSSALVNDNELKALANAKLKVRLSSSVENLLKKFPKIKLPSSVSESDISPVVAINENEVANWFEQLKKKPRGEKNRRKKPKETIDLSEVSSTSENNDILHESLSIESSENLSVELSESISSTSLMLISRESPIPPDELEVDKDQYRSFQETPLSNTNPCLLNNSSSPCKRTSSVELDSPQSKKIKTNSNLSDGDSIDSLVTVKYINKSLSICDICNGILNNPKNLKKHKMSHMRCTMCKKTFKTMEETKKHNESGCPVKRIINNLPCLELKRCDGIEESSKECPKASEIQSDKITPLVAKPNSLTESEKQNEDVVKETFKIDPVSSKPNVDTNEILLISDDEDEVTQPAVVEKNTFLTISNDDHNSSKNSCDTTEVPNYTYKKTIATSNEIALNNDASECQIKTPELTSSNSVIAPLIDISSINSDVDMTDCVISENGQHLAVMDTKASVMSPIEDNTNSNSSCNNKAQDSISKETTGTLNKTSLNIPNNKSKNVEIAAMRCNTSVITPNIEITGTNIIDVDFAANDKVLLKNLLRKVKISTKEAGIQTVLPCNTDIMPTFKKDKLFELKKLREYLNFYKIPINISYAANYSVRFSSDSSPISKHRTWSKVNTRVSKNVNSPNLPTSNSTVSTKIIGSSTPIATSSAERIPSGLVTNVERGNARTESSIPGIVTQRTQPVSNLINKDTETSVSPVPISESAPMTIHSTGKIPPLVPLVEKDNVGNESTTSTGVIMNTQINLNNQSVPSTVTNPVYVNIGLNQPTLNPNPPILLNYCLPNVNSYNMPNNYFLAQPSSSPRLPTSAATTDNHKGTSNNMPINYFFAQRCVSQPLPTSAATTDNAKGTSNSMPNNYLMVQPSSNQRLTTKAATSNNAKRISNKMSNNYVLGQKTTNQRLPIRTATTYNAKGSSNMPNNYVSAQPSSNQQLPTSAATTDNARGTSNNMPNNYFMAQPSFTQRFPTSVATTDNAKGTSNIMPNNYLMAQPSSNQRLLTSTASTDNAKGTSNNIPNNSLLAQPSFSQRLPTSAATTHNAKRTFAYASSTSSKYNNHAPNGAGPSRLTNTSPSTNANISSVVPKMNIVRVSNGTTIITPTHVVDVAGNSTRYNRFTAPITGCPPNKNMISDPGRKPSDNEVNVNFHNNISPLHSIDTPNVTNVNNNMPPPMSSFIPHRIPKTIPITAQQMRYPANTDPINQNPTTPSNYSSDFIQTIRVKNMSELR